MAFDDTATVSGSVVAIENGADEVGAKSCVVTVRPTLSGVSSVTETQTGRNLFDISTTTNGQINGTNGAYYVNANWQASDFFSVHGADLTLSWDTDSSNYYQVNLAFYDSEKHYVDGSNNTFANIYSKTFTIPSGAVYCRASWSISVGGSPAPRNNIRINLGSTDGGYTPYTTPTHYTSTIGRTIYGGTTDIVNGEGQETHAKMTFTGATDETWNWGESGGKYRVFAQLMNAKTDTNTFVSNLITPAPSASGYPDIGTGWINNNGRIVIGVDSSITSASDWKAYLSNNNMEIAYELADEYKTDFTSTGQEIPTRLGYNAFWSEQGDTELTYYKSGYGFTSVTVHKETPDGEPVVHTVKFHRIVYGGQADVVRGIGQNAINTIQVKNLNWTYYTAGTNPIFYAINVPNMKTYGRGDMPNIAIDGYTTRTAHSRSNLSTNMANMECSAIENVQTIAFRNDTYTSVSDMLSAMGDIVIGYEMDEYETFTFQPISMETDEGENTLFANEGDSAITYRKAVD